MVLTDMKEQFMHQSLYSVDILINPLTVFQAGIVFCFVVEIKERQQYLKKRVQIHHQTKPLDFIFWIHIKMLKLWNLLH